MTRYTNINLSPVEESTPNAISQQIPSIRLISATPSAMGSSTEASTSFHQSLENSWASASSPLAPKPDSPATKRRLIPKKSKLALLNVGKDKEKGKDISDIVRRVGGDSHASSKGGFEIYVDPTVDPDIGEIVMVKKKKSRAALDGMKWGALGEVTNVPSVAPKEAPTLLKVKNEDKEKWWSIGRGRKDSKEKPKEKENKVSIVNNLPSIRSKTPEPLKLSQDTRMRFNSLDSGILLNTPINTGPASAPIQDAHIRTSESKNNFPAEPSPPLTYSRAGTPTLGGLLAPPGAHPNPQGSIALRAMRSVRSMARIGSWAQLKNSGAMEEKEAAAPVVKEKEKTIKSKGKDGKEKKKKKEKDGVEDGEKKKKKKKKEKDGDVDGEKKKIKKEKVGKAQTLRLSTSSFEAGALTASPDAEKTLGRKKHSILGLGLPSTMRLPKLRNGSTASSVLPPVSNRLSVESAALMGRNRAGSTISTASSLRPVSVTSSASRTSSGSTTSVRWDEEGLETVKEQRNREREGKKKIGDEGTQRKKSEERDRESRHSSEGRRRTPLSEVFPEVRPQNPDSPAHPTYPILTIEEATSDGHEPPDDNEYIGNQKDEPTATPLRKRRARPLSEQLLGRSRPTPMYENEDGVLSILDAATNDLAQLINNLDLEATPNTPDMTPLRPSSLSSLQRSGSLEYNGSPTKKRTHLESPLKNAIRSSMASISSLRPYAQSQGGTIKASTSNQDLVGQQIAPWSKLIQGLSPVKEPPPSKPSKRFSATPPSTFRLSHKRTMTPAPEPEPALVFQPLQPPRPRGTAPLRVVKSVPSTDLLDGTVRGPPTFVPRSPRGSDGSPTTAELRRKYGHRHKKSSPKVNGDLQEAGKTNGVPIPPETRRMLGMSGTMGASDASAYEITDLDLSDPDSDIPDELQFILSTNSDREEDTLSFRRDSLPRSPSPGSPALESLSFLGSADPPPALQLPVFHAHLIDEFDNEGYVDEGGVTSEEDTKKSFDFTGELQKLNESGGSDRRSFVEQLESAFRTPAKVDLHYDFGTFKDGLLHVEIPPVPELPLDFSAAMESENSSQSSSGFPSYAVSRIADVMEPTFLSSAKTCDDSDNKFDMFPASRIIDVKEPTLLLGSSLEESSSASRESSSLNTSASSRSRPSDGQLDTSFKFGGLPSPSSPILHRQDKQPLTLSDIIPPPSHVRSLSASSMLEDDSVLKSIFAKATDLPEPRRRVNSDSSSKRFVRRKSIYKGPSRPSSGISFAGFDSFDEVRRGFEFNDNRPAFYPPPGATRRVNHHKHESIFSIASVSSYGRVLDPGCPDPFDFGLPSLRERPSSEDMSVSMSFSIDDTFSFLGRQPRRQRVDSDASSFYFKAPLPLQSMAPFNRGHRRQESSMSFTSQAPPISLYNRSYMAHRRNDSNTSASSVAQSYAMFGANGGRAAWARHRQDSSMDSVMSDFSAMRLGRPGIGDKMFDNGDHAMPLASISASPPESVRAHELGNRSSFDSILDDERRYSMDDSIFEKTGQISISSDSVFCDNYSNSQRGLLAPGQFRPLSMLSVNSVHSPMKEDDTMITMLGGGHVRRRSIDSMMEASPCIRVEKRKHSMIQNIKGQKDYYDSPNKARIVEKPSIASTSSYQFGGERMIRAQRGLLERQSLEDSCLIAEGEDLSGTFGIIPVFTRPGPTTRSRSSTCTSSSGGETPPLSSEDGSSISGDSQSSLDLSHLNMALANVTHPMSSISARTRVRARARGNGHRRRISKARASRTSVYETIEEEMSPISSPLSVASKKSSPTVCQPVFIVEPDTESIAETPGESIWDDERGIVALRKYYALRDEAESIVTESKRQWLDTPFSLFAVQSFQVPSNPASMQALLEHSVQNYGPLPSELRPRRVRSRTQSRPSPYPQQGRTSKSTVSPELRMRKSSVTAGTPVLRQIVFDPNSNVPSLDALKPFSPMVLDIEPKRENAFGLAPHARPRVGSTARRTALGWSKRSSGKSSSDQKENNVGQGMVMTPGESLRINRPRPRGRPTPSQARTIRV